MLYLPGHEQLFELGREVCSSLRDVKVTDAQREHHISRRDCLECRVLEVDVRMCLDPTVLSVVTSDRTKFPPANYLFNKFSVD